MHSVITIVNKRESVFWQQSLNMVLRCATITNRNNALKTWVDRMSDREREEKKRFFSSIISKIRLLLSLSLFLSLTLARETTRFSFPYNRSCSHIYNINYGDTSIVVILLLIIIFY